MLKVKCEACGAPYEVDPRRVPASGLKMRCPSCGASFHVSAQASTGAFDLDLPAPKHVDKGRAGRPAGAPHAAPDFADLPAPKARLAESLPENLADDLSDPSNGGPAFDLDLPAPKTFDVLGTRGNAGAALPKPSRIAPDFAGPAAGRPADFDLDLPAPKGAAPATFAAKASPPAQSGAGKSADFDLDLPAPKVGGFVPAKPGRGAAAAAPDKPAPARAAEPVAARPTPSASDMELDLPAPKRASPATPERAAAAPRPSLAGRDLDDGFDLDLPAPKGAPQKAAPAPLGDLDLPAPKPAAAKPRRADVDLPAPKPATAKSSMSDLDLPAPKAAAGQTPFGDLDLPAPKASAGKSPFGDLDLPGASAGVNDFDLDLPAPKAAGKPAHAAEPGPRETKAGGPQKSFARPSAAEPAARAAAANKLAANLPKDSLAVDPRPLFAGQRASGALGDLDEMQVSFTGSMSEVDLPAPSNLPAVKKPAPAGTMLGLGKLAKDSLDIPRGFEHGQAPSLEDRDLLPAPADLPQAKAAQAKPATKSATLGDFDLPEPPPAGGKKKPAPGSTMLGLGRGGVSKDSLDLSPESRKLPKQTGTALGIGEMLDESLAAPAAEPSLPGGFDLELDLPPPSRGTQDASGPIDLERLSLPSAPAAKTPFGATMALGADDIEMNDHGLSFPGLEGKNPFDARGRPRPSNQQTIELDSMLEFGSQGGAASGAGGNAFGELDFGLDDGPKTGGLPLIAPRPAPMPQPQQGFDTRAVEAELLGGEAPLGTEARPRKKKKKARREGKGVPGYVWPIVLVVLIGASGMAAGTFTSYGYFGVYLLEQLLPAAGDPAQVAATIAQAEKIAKSDTFLDVRKSLVVLSDARNEAGLNRELLGRSLLHEALYQLRFGEDAQSAQRSVAILSRVMERGSDAKGLTLARAADAARRGDISSASSLLAQVPTDKDAYRGLVAGEIALLAKQPEAADKAFAEALAQGGGARASWGAARALLARERFDEAEASAKTTLAQSPLHSAALTFLGRRALSRGETAAALDFTRKATGAQKVGGASARPSRADRGEAWALTGQIEQLLEHTREAQAAYEAALAADPLRVDSLIGSGSMLMRMARARDALSRFESALSARPRATPDESGKVPMIEAALGAVQALLILERANEALPRVTALSEQFKDNADIALWQGHTFEALEKWPEAEAAFRRVVELKPDSFAGYVALSQLLFKKGRPEEGARVLAEATGKVKDSAEVRRMLGYSELTRNHLPEAIHHFQAALRFDGNDAGALLGLTTAQRKSGDLGSAEKSLAKLEKVDPGYAGLTLERGQLLESRGDYSAAANAYRTALEARPHDTDLKLRLGAALVTAGRLEEAEAILPEVLKERPTSAEAEHFVGRLLFAKKETAQAVQHFERSIAFDALHAEYHLYLAWAYLDQANLGAALASINKALERDPNLGDARWILGRIQLRTGAVKDAVQNFQLALKLKPGRVEALANMGDAYDQLRDLNAAIRSYQEAVRQVPENGDWWYRLGTLHLDKGSRDEARVTLAEAVLRGDRLIERPNWLADAHRLYADVLREGGRTAEALDHYRTFLNFAQPGHPDRAEIERVVLSGQR
jgi:predicted Zn finger-like uncharacterized protein